MMNQNLERVHEEKRRNKLMGGEQAIAKQKSQGKLNVRERIELFADKGTFLEFGLLADHTPSNLELGDKVTPADGVVTGTCLVEGRPVAVAAYDFTVLAGSMGEVGERKTERIRKLALEERIPMVWLLDSAGARIQEVAGAHFAGTGNLFFEQIEMSGLIPQVAAVMGPTAAGTSYIAALADYTPMVKGVGSMALAGPPLVKAAIGEDITTEELGGSKIHNQISGCADGEFENDEQCIAAVRKYLSFFPSHCRDKPPVRRDTRGLQLAISDEILSILPDDIRKAYDMKKVIKLVVDHGDFLEIKPDFAKSMIVGYARIMGHPVGIVANQPSFMGGAIDVDASDKAARFIFTCDAFQIPIVFLHDCPGFIVGSRVEKMGIIRHGAKLLHAVAAATVPKFSIVVRKSYGAGYYVMCGKGLKPDLIVGWPTAEISLMGAEGATNIVMKNRGNDQEAKDAKAAMVTEYKAKIGGLISARLAHIVRRGELVVLDFHVKRCPVCHGKSPALEQVIAKDLRAGRVQAFLVDFDEDTKLVRKYGVKYRNTALFLHKGVEVARVGGDFAHEKLAQALHDGFDAAFKKIDRK
ncbi:MAG: acyl-CoA carboxylase subunit beta [Deltaproteobacteria bacterium]|nr:acyl-CoA carboxylase subunit beta [Deltaproteobacteria bacterium]